MSHLSFVITITKGSANWQCRRFADFEGGFFNNASGKTEIFAEGGWSEP